MVHRECLIKYEAVYGIENGKTFKNQCLKIPSLEFDKKAVDRSYT